MSTVTSREVAEQLRELAGRIEVAGGGNGQSVPVVQERFTTAEVPVKGRVFIPDGPYCMPPLIAERLPHVPARNLALALNRSALECAACYWHLLVVNSDWDGVVRMKCSPSQLPDRATDFLCPEPSRWVGPRKSAVEEAAQLNRPIMKVARNPKLWHVAVRDLRDEPGDD